MTVAKSRLFWALLIFAIVPILLDDLHLNVVDGMMVYFSLFWFFVFHPLMTAQMQTRWQSLIAEVVAYVFTGAVGVLIAVGVESLWMRVGAHPLLNSPYLLVAFPAYVLSVGLTEEFAKQIFVLIVLAVHRAQGKIAHPLGYMMLGISSGLGFSAVENIFYVQHGISFDVLRRTAGLGTVTALSRALYTPFLHAIWAGIVAYGLGLAAQQHGRRCAMTAWWAFLTAAVLHGLYDASLRAHGGVAVADVAISYLIFLSLLLNARRQGARA